MLNIDKGWPELDEALAYIYIYDREYLFGVCVCLYHAEGLMMRHNGSLYKPYKAAVRQLTLVGWMEET